MGCIFGRESVFIEKQKYMVKCRLGEGGFSYVDLVEHERTRKPFALKRILCHSVADQSASLKEVEYMKLFHGNANIIQAEGLEVVSSTNPASSIVSEILLLMPYYGRGTLQDQLDLGEHLSVTDLLLILTDLCSAVQTFHTHRPVLAHRDIKPANVLITDMCGAVLMDLGSVGEAVVEIKNSREGQQLQDDAAERCTMPYRAPELFNVQTGDKITQATDIWSLGCVFYACIYLRGPFDEIYKKGGSIALAVVGGNVEYPDQLRYPYKLVELTKLMLNVDAARRPSIENVMDRLEAIQNAAANRV